MLKQLPLARTSLFVAFAVASVVVLFLPLISFAQPLVECGNNISAVAGGGGTTWSNECTICHFMTTMQTVLNYLVAFITAVAAVLFLNAGVLYVLSPSNIANIERAHRIFVNTLIGIIVVLAAWLFTDTIMKTMLPGDLGDVNGYGPWNTILCLNTQNSYTIQSQTPLNLQINPLVIPRAECSSLGGTCSATCAAGTSAIANTSCDGGSTPLCCVPSGTTDQYGDTCTLTASGYAGQRGTCTSMDTCDGFSEISNACGTTLVCCQGTINGGGQAPASGYCSTSYLSQYFGAANASAAGCICNIESTGDPFIASNSDRCRDGNAFSFGLFQINLTVHRLGGLDCPSAFSGTNFNCTVTNTSLYNQCVAQARTPSVNIPYAVQLFNNRGGWGDWANSARQCGL